MKSRQEHFDGSKFIAEAIKGRPHIRDGHFWYQCKCCGLDFILDEKEMTCG